MNSILIIAGFACILVGTVRAMIQHNATVESGPQHGDRRIVIEGSDCWMEQYHAFPGWSRRDRFDTLDDAKGDKARWDAIHKRIKEPQVIVE